MGTSADARRFVSLGVFESLIAAVGVLLDKLDIDHHLSFAEWSTLAAFLVCLTFSGIDILRGFGVEFGSLQLSGSMQFCNVLVSVLVVLPALYLSNPGVAGQAKSIVIGWTFYPFFLVVVLNLRGFCCLVIGFFNLILLASTSPGYLHSIGNAFGSIGIAVSAFLPYVRDQRLILLPALIASTTLLIGQSLHRQDLGVAVALFFTVMILNYATVLFSRRARVLPPALRHCKFLRLGALRSMGNTASPGGLKLKRSQDMFEDDFGNVAKAKMLLITSHRWLDRYTCDKLTPSFPNGLRLASMLKRVNEHYPVTFREAFADGWGVGILRLWNGMTHSGSDVLLFFDFAALPQIGKRDDGSLIERTEEELKVFKEALPAMGMLYTTFDVLVIPEVTDDVQPYFSSGWCSSEFYSAMLADVLKTYSFTALEDYVSWLRATHGQEEDRDDAMSLEKLQAFSGRAITQSMVVDFQQMFSEDLKNKRFFNESDRAIVDGIVNGQLILRLLHDAIRTQDVDTAAQRLAELSDRGLLRMLDHPVNSELDTCLHLAARANSPDIMLALLDAGADASLRNLRGDLPTELFMCRRCSAAADVIRQSESPHIGVHEYIAI
eukprot:TRINITY_DN5740_c0_g1_i4.p1 TRINITY_DN5740_c0_g1~~TRINITY_DN5740_c0_g1_i4.p1  ORF type:complete len:607 (-),score=67.75 TRINITY_DN5740_c0_g1_i4:152-1972(-)